ncbi:MAG TPA: tryptophan synthase subunit alpha [Nitrososphaera sp.]|nr:tryptophan synthase subunit alpha [Nitrososphaera sp.]
MQNRISEKFAELARRGERALICYVVAGYPDIKTSQKVIESLVKGGADIIEIGIPFSDPIADGPTIQAASHSALERGVTPEKALELAKSVRKKYPKLPLLAMTYYNILVHPGVEKFMSQSKARGIDGFILPDVPVEEAQEYAAAASKLGLATVFLASPNTTHARLERIVGSSSGFLYLVSVYGITGARKSFEDYTLNAIKGVKEAAGCKVPVAVGFGISTPAHARFMIGAGADAVIVGSAIIDKISGTPGKRTLAELQSFARSMKHACRAR